MSITKYNEDNLLKINNNIQKVKDYTDNLSKLSDTNRDNFWRALKKILVESKDAQQKIVMRMCMEKSAEHPGTTLANIKFLMGGIDSLDEIMDLVEKNDVKIAEATTRIKELENMATETKSNIEAQ